jgi:hypothetical protein
MAIEKVIEIKVQGSAAQKNLDLLNSTLEEQRQILVELERELIKIEQIQSSTSKTNLAAQKKLTEQANHLKDSIKDQRLALKQLNSERRQAVQETAKLGGEEAKSTKIFRTLDALTGGYAHKVRDAYQALGELADGLKSVTAAQIRLTLAQLASPIGLVTAATVALTGAIIELGTRMTDGLVSRMETFTNFLQSFGNAQGFIMKQGMSMAAKMQKQNEEQAEKDRLAAVEAENKKREALMRLQQQWKLEDDMMATQQEAADAAFELEQQALRDVVFGQKIEQERTQFGQYMDLKDLEAEIEIEQTLKTNKIQLDAIQARYDAEQALRMQNIDNVQTAFGILGMLAGKNRVLQAIALVGESALGIAKIVISNQTANLAVVEKYAAIPGFGQVAAAGEIALNNARAKKGIALNLAATATGLAQIKAPIAAPAGSSGGSIGGRGGATGVEQTPPSFNVVGSSSASQIADVIAGVNSKPMRAYVVASDVSTAQSLERNIVKGASL